MNSTILAIVAVIAGGTVVGSFARPAKWRSVLALAFFGLGFLALDLATAVWFKYTLAQIGSLLLLTSSMPDPEGILGGIAIAYAAILGAIIFATRVARLSRVRVHEP